ncbi:MAG TPA: MBL fold metallo-hydrolase, partial [Methylomirabilota bacterium]|nr:MBL fold metallo-hydrolase [Methylomirabilota bacterium]
MRRLTVLLLAVSLVSPLALQPRASAADNARALVRAAIAAMGGEERLRAVHAVALKAIGHRYMLEQSERPEGPWLIDYYQISETRDLDRGRLRQERQSRGCGSTECWKSAEWDSSTIVVSGHAAASLNNGKFQPARASTLQAAEESLALGPERVLLLALAAPDLRIEAGVSLHGFAHHVVAFHWEGKLVRIFLSARTSMPTAMEVTRTRPYEFFWSPWGDVTSRVSYALWMLEPGGLRYPREWACEFDGQPDWTLTINEVSFNPPVKNEDFAIPDDVSAAFAARVRPVEDLPLGNPSTPAKELAPGIVQVPAAWNIIEVRQADGIVIIEAPISNGYSARVIEDAQRRFPGLPVKAVVTTSDSWPHFGGLREYSARNIPVYALDLNRFILEKLFSAPHRLQPDALALQPHPPKITYVSARVSLGRGDNALEIVPLRALTGERQMAVYFPAQKLLYTSDLFQRDASGGFFLPQTISEAVDMARREKLDVHTCVGMHLGPTSWKDVEAAVAARINQPPL